jgi:hypothetical protein
MSAVPPAQRKRQVQSSIADCVTSVFSAIFQHSHRRNLAGQSDRTRHVSFRLNETLIGLTDCKWRWMQDLSAISLD